MEETYAHELEGQTVIISSMPQDETRKPVGYALQVRLLSGVLIQNVIRVDFEPILPNSVIYAALTLVHADGTRWRELNEGLYREQVCVQTHIDIPAIVKEEKHTNG